MIRETVLTFSEGKLALPQEVQDAMHLVEGTKLRLVSASKSELRLSLEEAGRPLRPEDIDWSAPWVPNNDWRSLRGILSGHPDHDTTKVRHEERMWELEHDERKFGPFPKP